MAGETLTQGNDIYISNLVPTGGETANSIMALGGDDQVQGNQYVDYIHGGNGNDQLWGMGGDDVLLGEAGNDSLNGGSGNDLLLGGEGNDILYGDTGSDRLWGGTGDDSYIVKTHFSGGVDMINDDKSPTGQTGFGGGNDLLFMKDVALADLFVTRNGNNLMVTTKADAEDGQQNTGVIIEDFFLGGNNVVEKILTSDGYEIDTTVWL
ncbi:hypothetical protein N473_03875 [Pseudoalteromonas luteoviolacea CPMOR-1]|uniref:Calcium-binding protein n=2 Tax=Pseudoalteromonas luteoviolacea TaxID=43657 RepID=A0A023Q0T5_9GAMM|nr:calcium-binding protein [Pseudoalteromonas luteoviolacea]AHX39796.1 hypothetical protein [Pseudoalteromonas luteoviolacea]KZN59308.1 hypothetical protein N473_03875 [Pseudoalteromonas luteoviolacea CPMOR-1]